MNDVILLPATVEHPTALQSDPSAFGRLRELPEQTTSMISGNAPHTILIKQVTAFRMTCGNCMNP